MNQVEMWAPVEGFEGLYEVSNLGRVKRLDAVVAFGIARRKVGGVLKGRSIKGYVQVTLTKKRRKHFKYAHCLVARAFVANPLGKPEVNHKDGIRWNNAETNLEWVTRKENHAHKISVLKHGYGSQLTQAKLVEEQVREIRRLLKSGHLQAAVALRFGVSKRTIQCIAQGITWKQVA